MNRNREMKVSVLGVCVSLRFEHPDIQKEALFLYRDYVSDQKPHVVINVHCEDPAEYAGGRIIYQTDKWALSEKNGRRIFSCDGDYPAVACLDPDLRSKSIDFFSKDLEGHVLFYAFMFWLVCAVLMNLNLGAMFHACGVVDGNKGFFFVGPSGSGKTAISGLRGNRALIEDSNIVIRKYKDCFKMLTHPWGKNKVKTVSQDGVIINSILFIEHAKNNFIVPINGIVALKKLIKETLFYNFWDDKVVEKNLRFCAELVEKTNCYRLGFVPDKAVWELLSASF